MKHVVIPWGTTVTIRKCGDFPEELASACQQIHTKEKPAANKQRV
jgi:hypothetical protein